MLLLTVGLLLVPSFEWSLVSFVVLADD